MNNRRHRVCNGGSNKNNIGTTGNLKTCSHTRPLRAVNNLPTPNQSSDTSTVIPFASSGPVLVSYNGTLSPPLDIRPIIGFGSSHNIIVDANAIDLSNVDQFAFTVPRQGALTSLSVFFYIFAYGIDGETATMTAEVYRAPVGENIFTPTGLATKFSVLTESNTTKIASGFNVPLAVGDRLVLVLRVTVTATHPQPFIAVVGTVSAGVSIE